MSTRLQAPLSVLDGDPDDRDGEPLRSGLLTVAYDYGGPEEEFSKARATLFQSGFVGFVWQEAKYEVQSLQIHGILDKRRAVDLLRQFDEKAVKKAGAAGEDFDF